MKILYILATRARPQKCIAVLDNIHTLSRNKDFQILVAADLDDKTMCNDEMRDRVSAYSNTKIHYGISTGKLNAINRDIFLADEGWDIIINISDDQRWLVEGYDLEIIADMQKYFPNTDGFLHYPDQSVAHDKLCTMSIMGHKYFSRFNYIYHPDYHSLWADNEATEVAKKLGRHIFIDKNIMEHRHHIWKKSEKDALYERNETKEIWDADEKVYHRRKKINFGL